MVRRRIRIISYSAKDAIERWHRQYGFASRLLADGSNAGEKSKKLLDLKNPTKSQVEAIIGSHGGWTRVWCGSCHEHHPKVASFGCDEFGCDETVEVCESCLRAALKRLAGLDPLDLDAEPKPPDGEL
jgi:hypothetical protein